MFGTEQRDTIAKYRASTSSRKSTNYLKVSDRLSGTTYPGVSRCYIEGRGRGEEKGGGWGGGGAEEGRGGGWEDGYGCQISTITKMSTFSPLRSTKIIGLNLYFHFTFGMKLKTRKQITVFLP